MTVHNQTIPPQMYIEGVDSGMWRKKRNASGQTETLFKEIEHRMAALHANAVKAKGRFRQTIAPARNRIKSRIASLEERAQAIVEH